MSSLARSLLGFILFVCFTATSFAQPPPSPNHIGGKTTKPLDSGGQTKVDLALSNLSNAGYPQVAAAVQNGTVKIVELDQTGSGASDHDTLGVNTENMTPEAIAATLAHEFSHSEHSR